MAPSLNFLTSPESFRKENKYREKFQTANKHAEGANPKMNGVAGSVIICRPHTSKTGTRVGNAGNNGGYSFSKADAREQNNKGGRDHYHQVQCKEGIDRVG